MLSLAKILLFSNDEREICAWETLFEEQAVTKVARSLQELRRNLEEDMCDVVFCGWLCSADTWRDVLSHVQQCCPDLPVVIYSRTGGEAEWMKVLEAGAFDLLVAPYEKHSVLPVLEQAVCSHAARRLHTDSLPQVAANIQKKHS